MEAMVTTSNLPSPAAAGNLSGREMWADGAPDQSRLLARRAALVAEAERTDLLLRVVEAGRHVEASIPQPELLARLASGLQTRFGLVTTCLRDEGRCEHAHHGHGLAGIGGLDGGRSPRSKALLLETMLQLIVVCRDQRVPGFVPGELDRLQTTLEARLEAHLDRELVGLIQRSGPVSAAAA